MKITGTIGGIAFKGSLELAQDSIDVSTLGHPDTPILGSREIRVEATASLALLRYIARRIDAVGAAPVLILDTNELGAVPVVLTAWATASGRVELEAAVPRGERLEEIWEEVIERVGLPSSDAGQTIRSGQESTLG